MAKTSGELQPGEEAQLEVTFKAIEPKVVEGLCAIEVLDVNDELGVA